MLSHTYPKFYHHYYMTYGGVTSWRYGAEQGRANDKQKASKLGASSDETGKYIPEVSSINYFRLGYRIYLPG